MRICVTKPKDTSTNVLPPLWEGARRTWFVFLVALGIGQAALSMVLAWAMIELNRSQSASTTGWALVTMALVAVGIGALRVQERIVAEKLGQDYVHDVRRELVRSVLTPGDSSSLGITVARTTNDLSSVRNWVAQGIAPLVVAVPLLSGVLVAFALLDWRLAVGALIPLIVLVAGVALWAGDAYTKSRALRRTRGAMASRIAETTMAANSIAVAGGAHREINNIDKVAGRLIERSVSRAETLGLLRATGIVAAMFMTLVIAAMGAVLDMPPAEVVAAVAIAGIATTPLMDVGRIVEFRQSFLAARAVLVPTLEDAQARRSHTREHRDRAVRSIDATSDVHVYLDIPGCLNTPLDLTPGDRIVFTGDQRARTETLMRIQGLLMPPHLSSDVVAVGATNLVALPSRERREFIGHAQSGMTFERGTVLRAIRYRDPSLEKELAVDLFTRVGLDELEDGTKTLLRRGGESLTPDQRARLSLARALYGEPPLLIIEGLEADLDNAGRELLCDVVQRYPGVVILTDCPLTESRLQPRQVATTVSTRLDELRNPTLGDQDDA